MAISHKLFLNEKRTFVLKKKNVKNISWEKYVQARAFGHNGSYAPVPSLIEEVPLMSYMAKS